MPHTPWLDQKKKKKELASSSTPREVFSISGSIISGGFLPHWSNWLEISEGFQSSFLLMGQASTAHLRVASFSVFSLHAQLGCHDLPGAPEAKALGCESPGIHESTLARGFQLSLPRSWVESLEWVQTWDVGGHSFLRGREVYLSFFPHISL